MKLERPHLAALFALALVVPAVQAQRPGTYVECTIPATPYVAPLGPVPACEPCRPPKHDKLPAVPIAEAGTPPVAGPEQRPGGALAPQAFTVFRNTVVKPSGASTSNVGEPTTSHLGASAFQVGNWYAARSTDDGASWTHVNPYSKFSSADGGFCCDQYTIASAAHNLVVWELLYLYSPTTQKNTIRLACMVGAGNVGSATVNHYYDIGPANVGYTPGNWIDYVHLAQSNAWLYMAGNVFTAAGNYAGSFVLRLSLANMAAGQSATSQAFIPVFSSPRCSSGIDDTMYIGGHLSTGALRIHTWPDTAGQSSVDRTINLWYPGINAQTGPDGINFLSRCDNRITTGYHNDREVAFYWTSNAGGSLPRPFVRGVRFDRQASLAVRADENIWSSVNAWAYPAAATNSAGHVALVTAYGGGVYHPGCDAFLRDSENCQIGENVTIAGGNAGPVNGFGDYFSVQRHSIFPSTFVAAVACQRNGTGNANSEPHNVHFGRNVLPAVLSKLEVSSETPAGAAISLSTRDNYCDQNGTTPFRRYFVNTASVTLTAPATLGTRSFYRWRLDGVDQGLGVTTLPLNMTTARTAVAVYGNFTTPTVVSYGTACPGSGGTPNLATGGTPLIGTVVQHKLTNGPVNKGTYLVIGGSKTSWPPIALPFTLPGTTCTIYCDQAIALGQIVPAGGSVSWNIGVPNSATLVGGKLYAQVLNLDLGANLWSVTTTNGLEETVGGWVLN